MEWVLRSPQIHSTFGSLGYKQPDGYHVDENCNTALKTILCNIMAEDKILHSYRKNISFGQYVKKDLMPLLIHAKDEKTIELSIEVLVHLTTPVECLLSTQTLSKTDFGRQTIFQINNLLTTTKQAFSDQRITKVVVDFIKKNLEGQCGKLSPEQRTNINNCMLLLRNVLHIPEEAKGSSQSDRTLQNQIVWNIFSQSLDKLLINLMVVPEASYWVVTMVQLIALCYKDQHVVTLHKLLNLWLESTLSESSEDNESNTSPPGRGSEDSMPMFTSDPTSDSSDTGGSGKSHDEQNSTNNPWSEETSTPNDCNTFKKPSSTSDDGSSKAELAATSNADSQKEESETYNSESKDSIYKTQSIEANFNKIDNKIPISENSDCGYGTQIDHQGSISTSSNEDELPTKKPVHHKPHNPKQRANPKPRIGITLQERKRKKIVRRGKMNIINVHGLLHKTPTDDDISNVLKEFTVDFLLKGYNSLVRTLHNQIMTNLQLEIDTSHFFWLVTYFLKFATQIELDLEHLNSVLSYEIISYLTAEGVSLCEQFELALKLDGSDSKPCVRRLHLLVTAIREFVQTIEVYKKLSHVNEKNKETLANLERKICETEELRSLLVLLLRHYNPTYHGKQYLQDLVVTNHVLLSFVDNAMRESSYKGTNNMLNHIRQFATPKMMSLYGILLEDYASNGEFVNDCIFTIMHHVGGELDSLSTLFQPKILKSFTSIWKTDFEICDDWSDLIQYAINTFVKKPQTVQSLVNVNVEPQEFNDNEQISKQLAVSLHEAELGESESQWKPDEASSLSWMYMQCQSSPNVIDEIIKLFQDDGIAKSRRSIVKELYKQNLIDSERNDRFMKNGIGQTSDNAASAEAARDEEITRLCEQLANEGKTIFLEWVQKILLDTCFVKIYLDKKMQLNENVENKVEHDRKLFHIDNSKKNVNDNELPAMSSVSYHNLVSMKSVPLVPWNCELSEICKNLKLLQLLHKLGFHMPVDSGRVFIRIPHVWSAECLYEVAAKIGPINTRKLNFSLNDIHNNKTEDPLPENIDITDVNLPSEESDLKGSENVYRILRSKEVTAMVNFTPMPGSSFTPNGEGKFNKDNWLELVQRSQECKLSLNIARINETQSAVAPCAEEVPISREDCVRKDLGSRLVTNDVNEVLVPPPVVVAGIIKPDPIIYNVALPGSEDNSVCETATVASDLTRMYVSDEDEKPESMKSVRTFPFASNTAAAAANGGRTRKRRRAKSVPTGHAKRINKHHI